MTNELGTTLQDIEAKAERKREARNSLCFFLEITQGYLDQDSVIYHCETIRKYIEEN